MIADVVVPLLPILLPADLVVAVILVYLAWKYPDHLVLRERAFAAVVLAFVATIAAILAGVRAGILSVPPGVVLDLLAIGFVLVSIPALYWLFLLVTGRWRLGAR